MHRIAGNDGCPNWLVAQVEELESPTTTTQIAATQAFYDTLAPTVFWDYDPNTSKYIYEAIASSTRFARIDSRDISHEMLSKSIECQALLIAFEMLILRLQSVSKTPGSSTNMPSSNTTTTRASQFHWKTSQSSMT